ncbi:hypothetical protein IUY40_14020 [Flavobacterium sp. ALJ2]|uniref:CARDB domain-containing protein n=1 Tax=Flavobacterium sp. ALJ2 TaxID=2786960 RepID=UPI0018A111C1|nr:CARDB domain-containing protein [Flavobacterium sp. ALJ2]MBF7092649.1 hypothetical protein [Flavobacterium sp. ALJ2]
MIPNKPKSMKVKSFLVFIFLFLGIFVYAQNSLKVINATAGPGEKSKILIDLTNTDEVVGAEFTLTVPQGLIVNQKESKLIEGRKGDHAIYVNIEKNNPQNYHFVILSLTSNSFKENKGTLLEIPMEIPMNYITGQTHNLNLSSVVLSSKNAVDIGSDHTNGKLIIANALYPDLAVSGITSNESQITPNGKITLSWGVNNIGDRIAAGGWTEQISLISENTGIEYKLGSVSYDGDLENKKTISRNATFNLPKIIGIDGNVKIKINLIPNPSVKEPDTLKDNNKLIGTNTIVLEKVLYLTLDKKSIDENSTEVIRATVTQSGDRSTDNSFQITASKSGQLDIPASIKIPKNQSSVVFYIKPIDNTTADGNRAVALSLSGNDYPTVSENIEIIDNEVSIITLTPSEVIATNGDILTITLETGFAKSKDTKFSLTADQNSRWNVPVEIILPSGSKSVTFTVEVKNNIIAEPTVTGKITARAEGFLAGSTEIILKSSNIPTFEFEITPETISKGDGIYATYAIIKRLDKSEVSTSIKLKASVANALILPEIIDFPANVNQRKFNIGAINNGIVDGTRMVDVTADVYFSSCNCTIGAGNAGSQLIKTITILDSNGPALLVKANPATIKAGQENSGKITITRNTADTSTTIPVRLSSDAPTLITIPTTTIIPVGQESVEVTISTKIDADKKGDQTVRVQAEADSYSSGFAWILVTDQNKPDAIIAKVNTVPQAAGKDNIEVKTTVTNQGFAIFPKGSKIEYYLSKEKTPKNGILLETAELDKDIESGKSLDFIKTIPLPEQAGDYFLIVVVNSDKKINELSYINNESFAAIKLNPSYSATAVVSKSWYKSGETVTITGSTKMIINSSPAPNKDVEITITNGKFVRSYITKTNNSGSFAYDFVPLQGESGQYTVSAGYPGTQNAAQAKFNIIGFEWTNKPTNYLKWEVVTNTPFKGEFKLKNNGITTLSNIKIELPADTEFNIQSNPLTLAPGQEGIINYTILADKPSLELKYYEIDFAITSDEGAKLSILAYYHCKAQYAKITANPVSINTTMIKGSSRFYELAITNTGAIDAEKVKIQLPKLDWLKLKSPQIIEKIAQNETANIVLELVPTDKQQLNVPLTGNLAISLSNGEGLNVPFKVETVSEATGSLLIDVVDEYTYNTEKAPHVKGAKVIVRHPFSGEIMAEGITDENGLFKTGQIPEGHYTVNVTADKHDSYQNNLLVDPGKVTTQKVFISYQAVSYEWTVKPTEIEDEYQTDLVVKFETNVPKPVLIIEIDDPVLNLEPGQSRMSYATVTNHGLIATHKVDIAVGNIDGYTLTPLINKIDVLNAKASLIVPVLITRTSSSLLKAAGGSSCQTTVLIVKGTYICETEKDVADFKPYYTTVCKGPGSPPLLPCTGPNCGGQYPGGTGWGIFAPWAGVGDIITSLPNICDPCFLKIVKTIWTCTKIVRSVTKCIVAVGVAAETGGLTIPVAGYYCYKAIESVTKCVKSFIEAYEACGSNSAGRMMTGNSVMDETYRNMVEYDKFLSAYMESMKELFNDINPESEGYNAFADYVIPIVETKSKFSENDITNLTNLTAGKGITSENVTTFVTRWNNTVDAWSQGIYEPNATYPSIVNKNKLDQNAKIVIASDKYAKLKGYTSSAEMIEGTLDDLEKYIEEQKNNNSVCATVTVKFSQKMTMTREAFEGTLTMNNGSDSNTLKGINLDLIITDDAGNDMTHLFQINKDVFLSGTGIVGPQSNKSGTVLFIPTKEAAPTVTKSYSFGGTLSYLDPFTDERVTVQLYPVTLEVNPSPDLVLHYFMQRDIIGDDPLTEKTEPMVPAEMALLIKNEGYGQAKNVQVQSMQPEIVENKKGVLIDFEIIGSNFNNEPRQLGLLNVDFGDIEPQKAAIGQWWFTSTLLGHFVEYDLKVKHLSSYGNKNLSLIKASYVHELIKSVKAYGVGQDNIGDFLVNDIPDANDTPDAIYYSNGGNDEVYKVSSASVSNLISPSKLTTTLTMNSSKTGWNYGNLSDPGRDKYRLVKVVRNSDHLELPLQNFWQTFVTLRDGANPKYENNLHFVDDLSGLEKYTLYYTPINTNVPKVVSFESIPSTTTKAIESVQVNFNKAINPSTFTAQNITLIHQGNKIPFNDSFIGKVNDSTYVLNVKTLAIASGYYELTVQCAGIKDLEENVGVEGKSVSWTQIIGELGIIQFKTDQTEAQAVNSVEIEFNKIVKPIQFTKDKLKLNGKPLDNISIVTENNQKYTIVGLTQYNLEKAEYELTVDLPSMKAEDDSQGLIAQSHKWKVDLTLPEVDQFIPQFQGAVNNQNVTDMQIVLNKPIQNNFEASWVTLYKGSANQNVKFTVTKQDDLHYLISGLGEYTDAAGGYKLVIDQSNFTDASGNSGNGSTSTMWTVKFDKPSAPEDMHITPNRGISATDNITSGNDLVVKLKTTGNKQTIELYAITPTGRVLVTKQYLEIAGELNIPINGYTGKNSFEAIVYDEFGNASDPIGIETYIDVMEFDGTINAIKNNSVGCSETEYLQVLFTDEIIASEFTKDALIIKTGGIVLTNEKVEITKISDMEFQIENIDKFNDNGDITFGIDLSKLHKKSSGLQGRGVVSKNAGTLNSISASITGDLLITESNATTTYTATPNMLRYNWSVTGGDIIEEVNNTVTIKWTEKGTHNLSLTYETPELCSKRTLITIKVDATLSIEDNIIPNEKGLLIAPVANNGTFTLSLTGEQGTFMLTIYDVGGKMVYKQDKINVTDNFKREIHTHIRTTGIYYLVLHNSETSYKSKFLIN